MLLHILKKDLKKKRTMNVILLLFVILAAMFLAGSVNNLLTITGAVEHFLEISKAPNYLAISLGTEEEAINSFLEKCDYVEEYEKLEMYTLMEDEVSILKNEKEEKFQFGATVAVGTVPQNFLKVFGEDGKLFTLKSGEIALPKVMAKNNGLSVGDRLLIEGQNGTMEFTLKVIVKDAVMGSEMMGFKRMFVCKEDYQALAGDDNTRNVLLYGVNCTELDRFQAAFKAEQFRLISEVDESLFYVLYIFDMLIAGILIVVSICLILIAFLILRFTISFTLQEDDKEIGIMKAIGIREFSIRGIYLIKYLAIAVVGSVVGLVLSFPLEKLLLSQAMQNLVLETSKGRIFVNVLCALLIVLLVVLFCFLSTGKVKRFTVMEAIRNGGSGERYRAKNVLALYKRKKMPSFVYLAMNDVAGGIRSYLVLAAIFLIGTLEILLPLAAIHTLKDDDIIRTFHMQPCDVVLDNGSMELYVNEKDRTELSKDLKDIREELSKSGVEAEVWLETYYKISCCGTDEDNIVSDMTMQQTGKEEEDYDVVEGQLPLLPNEVAVAEKSADELGVSVGDYLYYQFPEGEKAFLVTGIYQSMLNMGKGFQVSSQTELPFECTSGVMSIQVAAKEEWDLQELLDKVSSVFPDYKVKSCSEYIDDMIGGVVSSMNSLKYLITLVVIAVNVMISVLTMKTLITRERGEIAMLKSIGFSNRSLRAWQSTRILLVLFSAILAGTLLARLLSPLVLGPIFSMMGATRIQIVTDPLETYVIFPLLLLFATGAASYLCAHEVNKVDLKEINTLE